MGTSTDGILVFGFDIGVEDEQPLENILGEGEEFDDFIADEAGIEQWSENVSADYWQRRKIAIKSCPVELVTHCSYNYPMYILAVRGTQLTASRGYPEEVISLHVDQEKIDSAKNWCETHGIEWQEPKWLLCSLWG